MKLRADHVAGAAFVGVGLLIIALSGDLPFGELSFPGAGFLPRLVAVLLILLGASLFLRARESRPFSEINWDEGRHALSVIAVAATAVALYIALGFIITMILMIIALMVLIERKNVLRATLYATAVVVFTYVLFTRLLEAPLPPGVLGYI